VGCPVAYYHRQSDESFAVKDVNTRIGQKETDPSRPVCYCFDHDVAEIEAQVAATGNSALLAEIGDKCRQGLDRCELTNPQGSCCLSNVRTAIKQAQEKLGVEESKRDEELSAAGCCTDDACEDSAPSNKASCCVETATDAAVNPHVLAKAFESPLEARRAAGQLYRMLAGGRPVPLEDLGSALGVSISEARELIETSFASSTEYDQAGRVISFGGLTLGPTEHLLKVEGRVLYAWCALDTLFLPRILGKDARVQSTCPISGQRIEIDVGPNEVRAHEPKSVFLSIVVPEPGRIKQDVREAFCCHVHFFASQQAADVWLAKNEGAQVVALQEGFDVAQAVADEITIPLANSDSSTDDRARESTDSRANPCCGADESDHQESSIPGDEANDARARRSGALASTGAVGSAILSSACCWLPLLLIGFGMSASGVAGFFEEYRLYFLAGTGVFLVVAYYLVFFRKVKCEPGSACAMPNRRLMRFNRMMVVVATVAVLAFSLFPNYVGYLVGAGSTNDIAASDATATADREFKIAGMTCEGCVATLQSQIAKVPGVSRADISYESGLAKVFFVNEKSPPKNESILSAIKAAGFTGSLIAPTKTIQIQISGMTCEACAVGLADRLKTVNGVKQATVDYEAKQATVTLTPNGKVQSVLDVIDEEGFKSQIKK